MHVAIFAIKLKTITEYQTTIISGVVERIMKTLTE